MYVCLLFNTCEDKTTQSTVNPSRVFLLLHTFLSSSLVLLPLSSRRHFFFSSFPSSPCFVHISWFLFLVTSSAPLRPPRPSPQSVPFFPSDSFNELPFLRIFFLHIYALRLKRNWQCLLFNLGIFVKSIIAFYIHTDLHTTRFSAEFKQFWLFHMKYFYISGFVMGRMSLSGTIVI